MTAARGLSGLGGWILAAVLAGAGAWFLFTPLPAHAQSGCRPDQVWNGSACVCPPGQTDDGGTTTCHVPRPPPCAAGTIDIQGNGQNDGGDDCQALDRITPPAACSPSGADFNGTVTCSLPGSQGGAVGWGGIALRVAPGCMEISRTPFPRGMANFPKSSSEPGIQFNIRFDHVPGAGELGSWIVPPGDLGIGASESGGYLAASSVTPLLGDRSDMVRGLSLGELAGGGFGSGFNTQGLLGGDAYPYPNIRNVRAYLVFKRMADAIDWQLTDSTALVTRQGGEMWVKFPRASFPAHQNGAIVYNGMDKDLNPVLPAFRIRVQTQWELDYVAEWDVWGVNASNGYVYVGHQGPIIDALRIDGSWRVWGGGYLHPLNRADYRRQPRDSAPFCNQGSYIAVPVIEGQAVLTR